MKLEKITSDRESSRRRYEDACATAHALDLIGERWAMLVVRELMLGPRRFSDLRGALPGISANVLTQRLEGLEATGILVRRTLPPPVRAKVYELTPWGYEMEPIFQTMGRWAARSPHHDPGQPLSAVSLFMSMRTMIDGARAEGFVGRFAFVIRGEVYLVRIRDQEVRVQRDLRTSADLALEDAVIEGEPEAMAAVIYGGQPLEQMERAGAVRVGGDRDRLAHYLSLFVLPPKLCKETNAGRKGDDN